MHIAVIGGGVAGLVAALECAKVGTRVTVFEASDQLGGAARTVELDGLPVDMGADSLTPALDDRLRDLGLGDALGVPETETRWVAGVPGVDAAPLPDDTVLGIPENMFSDASRRILGTGGAWRAYMDRLRPPLTIGHEQDLAKLVRTRMGQKVLDRLVAPLTAGVFGTTPDRIDVDLAAPGLNAALTRTGSLSGAVAAVRSDESGVRGLVGGMARLVDALAQRLALLEVEVRTQAAVTSIERSGDEWVVSVDAPEATDAATTFDAVIVACDESAARRLLAPVVTDLDAAAQTAAEIETVALVVDAPALDNRPRGAEIVTVPGSHRARSALHLTAKWGWLAHRAGVGRHVIRVSFDATLTAELNDDELIALACDEASTLFGTTVDPGAVRASWRTRLSVTPPRAVRGQVDAAARVRRAVEAVPHLAATGAWLSGSGLAQVAPDAAAAADRLRRSMLF
ncbi:FAD-binding protein [Microbacterium protaetiae]|uniref:FAD-binding protein n=1 Tax=Microbacterium protaetiae TaxID=2509458 RepID=A0A4P6EKA8_9MICO|nr:FAD-binding protein [Microbacterium protaetiae]